MRIVLTLLWLLVTCSVFGQERFLRNDFTTNGNPVQALKADYYRGPLSGAVDIILDTDLGEDVDDAFDMGILHGLADNGEVNILAVGYSRTNNWGAAAIETINRYYGRGHIPVGMCKEATSYAGTDTYGTHLRTNFYNLIGFSSNAVNVTTIYRKVLASKPNNSVTMVFVGQLRNLLALYNSPADSLSASNGAQLINAKVKDLVIVAGQYPGPASEYNFTTDSGAAYVLHSNLTCTITYAGIEIGNLITNGSGNLTWSTLSPVRQAAIKHFAALGGNNRQAWGGAGLLYAARGTNFQGSNYFSYVNTGTNRITGSGDNQWITGPVANQKYLTLTAASNHLASVLDGILDRPPLLLGSALQSGKKVVYTDRVEITSAGSLSVTGIATFAAGLVTPPSSTITINADDFEIDDGFLEAVSNYKRLQSDNAVAANRTFKLYGSAPSGTRLTLEWIGANAAELIDDSANVVSGNVRLNGNWTPTQYDTISLIHNGTDWIELGRSPN